MSERWEDRQSEALLTSMEAAKRQTVPTACERCRTKKVKCDGRRPCSECVRRSVNCVFSAREDETPKQTAKRKFDELSQAHNDLKDLFNYLTARDHAEANDLFVRMRNGQPLESVLRYARLRERRRRVAPYLSHEQHLRHSFLTMLAQSTASLYDINDLARTTLDGTHPLPPLEIYSRLKDKVITLRDVSSILSRPGSLDSVTGLATDQPSLDMPDGSYSGPTFWVPASPWTDLTNDDEGVSHLITIFLTHLNPWYRCVETDLFIRDMRRGQKPADYCSSFLVNAILAWASLFTEYDVAFFTPGQYLTRGHHFHDEALRLWQMEEGRASITNMQALAALSIEGSIRGNDKQGLALMASAVNLNQSLPNATLTATSKLEARDYARARACTWWLIVYLDLAFAFGLFQQSDTIKSNFLDAPDVMEYLTDGVTYFASAYPATSASKPLRMTLLLQARCELTRYTSDVINLVLPGDSVKRSVESLPDAVQKLRKDFSTWHDGLPADICYNKDMPPCLLELHGQYVCLQMLLHRQAALSLSEPSESAEDSLEHEGVKASLHRYALQYAYDAVAMLRDYRETWGLKIVRLMVVNCAMTSVFVFLHELSLHRPHPPATLDAFVECYRCLIGLATQLMLPRGITRMVYRTALKLKIELPDVIVQMLEVMADTAWKPTDAEHLNSSWPNWTLSHTGEREDLEMGQLLRRWERLDIEDQDRSTEGRPPSRRISTTGTKD